MGENLPQFSGWKPKNIWVATTQLGFLWSLGTCVIVSWWSNLECNIIPIWHWKRGRKFIVKSPPIQFGNSVGWWKNMAWPQTNLQASYNFQPDLCPPSPSNLQKTTREKNLQTRFMIKKKVLCFGVYFWELSYLPQKQMCQGLSRKISRPKILLHFTSRRFLVWGSWFNSTFSLWIVPTIYLSQLSALRFNIFSIMQLHPPRCWDG